MEGIHDIQFLKGISAVLQGAGLALPDVDALEAEGRLIFVPFGGSDPGVWATRFAPLGVPELHLYDREVGPDTKARFAAAQIVNARAGCRAFVTRRPTLECYLHPEAIWQATGIRVAPDEDTDVVEAVARERFARASFGVDWPSLPVRSRKRAKHLLYATAVRQMTACAGATFEPVEIGRIADGHVAAHWLDGGIPQRAQRLEWSAPVRPAVLDRAAEFVPNSAMLWETLGDASRTTAQQPSRFALDAIQLRGSSGEVVATDGRQLLARSGFCFP